MLRVVFGAHSSIFAAQIVAADNMMAGRWARRRMP
jgi:hypothetical protein